MCAQLDVEHQCTTMVLVIPFQLMARVRTKTCDIQIRPLAVAPTS